MIITVGLAVSDEGVHVMHDIELAVIVTKRIFFNRIGLIYNEPEIPRRSIFLAPFLVLLEGHM